MARPLLTTALALLLFLSIVKGVTADHQVYLPYAGQTWMAQQIKANQEQVWCADARSSAYPQFLNQVRAVNDQYEARVGIRHRQVGFTDSSCQIKHTMPDESFCSGCAGQIFYANRPVTIQYKWQLGYSQWETTIGHELGHGILGQLHEQYRDSGGSIGCTRRTDTVMDCGSGVRYPTPLDVSRGCAIIATAWCGQEPQPPPPCDPCWDGARWQFSNGWSFVPDSGCGEWWDPENRLMFGACNDSWNGRYVVPFDMWDSRGDTFFAFGRWNEIP